MNKEALIRWVYPKDLKAIIALCKEHAAYEQASYDSNNKEFLLTNHLFQPTASLKCLVVEQEATIIGYATFMKQFSTWDAVFYIYLDCLYLKEKARGQQIGLKIMNEIKDFAKTQKIEIIQWQTPTFNNQAISFYERLGAVKKSKERFFWMV